MLFFINDPRENPQPDESDIRSTAFPFRPKSRISDIVGYTVYSPNPPMVPCTRRSSNPDTAYQIKMR